MDEQYKGAGRTKMLRLEEVIEHTGLSKSTIYDWSNPRSTRYDPTFPERFKLGLGTAVAWKEHEILAWINALSTYKGASDKPSVMHSTNEKIAVSAHQQGHSCTSADDQPSTPPLSLPMALKDPSVTEMSVISNIAVEKPKRQPTFIANTGQEIKLMMRKKRRVWIAPPTKK